MPDFGNGIVEIVGAYIQTNFLDTFFSQVVFMNYMYWSEGSLNKLSNLDHISEEIFCRESSFLSSVVILRVRSYTASNHLWVRDSFFSTMIFYSALK